MSGKCFAIEIDPFVLLGRKLCLTTDADRGLFFSACFRDMVTSLADAKRYIEVCGRNLLADGVVLRFGAAMVLFIIIVGVFKETLELMEDGLLKLFVLGVR